MLIGRTIHEEKIHEEKMLTNELDGSQEYKEATKFRLFPGIW